MESFTRCVERGLRLFRPGGRSAIRPVCLGGIVLSPIWPCSHHWTLQRASLVGNVPLLFLFQELGDEGATDQRSRADVEYKAGAERSGGEPRKEFASSVNDAQPRGSTTFRQRSPSSFAATKSGAKRDCLTINDLPRSICYGTGSK